VTRPDDPSRVAQFGRIALNATERGSIITSRLLGFAGRLPLHAERIEPAMVLDALNDVMCHTLGGKVTICLDLAPQMPRLFVDKSELETALINLAANARDAMPEGGTIVIAAAVDSVAADGRHPAGLARGDYVRVSVKDRGTGMDSATLRRAVEPFFTTKDIGRGTGLGLSMVKGFAEQAGGGLAIDSTPGEGTTVTVWLPVMDLAEQVAASQPVAREAPAEHKSGVRVLLVDDEDMVRETLSQGLQDAGFDVLAAQSGAEALALLDAGEPVDVLVSDYAMPGMDGLMVVREARARRGDLPVLILTGYVELFDSNASESSLFGLLSVLRKPIASSELARSIAAALTLAKNGLSGPH
jgi:CheY-like chemotaxis protein/anti-sigma regulatory factor (Ser/Thr protein kinase)